MADLAPVKLRDLYQGIFGSTWRLAIFIGPLLGGWVYEQLGAGLLWSGCLALGLLLALGFLAMRAPVRRRAEESTLHRFQ
ncbi:MAG: MFS transporter [Anaerolineales bacterium]